LETVKLGTILEMTKGKKPVHQSIECKTGYVPYVDIKAFETGIIDSYTDGEKCTLCDEGDILIVCDGSRSGLVGRAIKGAVGSTLAKVTAKGLTPEYLFYFLQGLYILLNTRKKGTGTPHVNPEILENAELVIPNTEQQKLVVGKIDELLSDLNASIEELQTAKAQLKIYRQSVLKHAFEGRLTAKWRSEHKLSILDDFNSIYISDAVFKDTSGDENIPTLNIPKEWMMVRLGHIFLVDIGATPSRRIASYWNGNINWVSSGEVKFRNISSTEEKITEDGVENSSTNVQPIGTVLLAMIGEGKTRGQAAVLRVNAAHNQNTAAILVSKTPCSPYYIYYYLMMNYEYTRRVGSGNNQKALNKERVRAIQIPFTSFDEQKQIVMEIESRLSVCEDIEKNVNHTLQQADALRQSILKKAFKGKLV
jgi:type I restriction enzyme S subunit